jgi:hypothetical protein
MLLGVYDSGAATGAVVVSYGISKIVLWMTGQFMSLNFTTVAYIGFACGWNSMLL